jgi:flagellar motor component MotA
MHMLQWVGLILVLVALLGSFGVTFGVIPTFASGWEVLIGVVGTYLYLKKPGRS